MSASKSAKIKRRILFIAMGAALLLPPSTAGAASLFWSTIPVHTAKPNQCLSFARDAMHDLNVQSIRVSRDEVAGTSGGAYAAITCIGTNPVTAVIMVVGDQDDETSALRDRLKQKIAGITIID